MTKKRYNRITHYSQDNKRDRGINTAKTTLTIIRHKRKPNSTVCPRRWPPGYIKQDQQNGLFAINRNADKLSMTMVINHKINTVLNRSVINEPQHDKTNTVSVRPAKTQISLGICPVWSKSSLSAWRNRGSLATQWAHSGDSDQSGRMPRLIWVFADRTLILLVLSCRVSNYWDLYETKRYHNFLPHILMCFYQTLIWSFESQ